MSVVDYNSRIKDICDSLVSINVTIEENEMVQVCLKGFTQKFRSFQTVICTRENTSSFFKLQFMLLVEENHMGAFTSTHADSKMWYMEEDRPRGRGG